MKPIIIPLPNVKRMKMICTKGCYGANWSKGKRKEIGDLCIGNKESKKQEKQ